MDVLGFARSTFTRPLLALALLAGSASAGSAAPSLRAVGTLADPAGIASRAEYALDVEDLDGLASSATLVLHLPEGRRLAERRSVEVQTRGVYWTGALEGGGRVLLTVYDGLPSGLVYAGPRTYEVSPGPGGPRLADLDTSAFPPCATDASDVADAPSGGDALDAAPADASGVVVMDALVLYTPEARDGVGGVSEIETIIQSAVNITNTAYDNSQVNARLHLIHTTLAPFGDSGSSSTDLSTVRNDPTVHGIRDAYGADLVGLIAHDIDGCGRGGVQRSPGPGFAPRAYQVTQRSCAVGNLSFAHEFGHNQGCEHDPANGTDPGNASFPYAFGHFHSGAYRTVMSYSSECTDTCSRAPYFSNSNVDNGGLATGIADERENYRTINNTASIVAAFRPSAVTLDLEQVTRSVREDEGTLELRVRREGRDDVPVTAQVVLRDVEAEAGVDFEPASFDLAWPAGDTSPRTLTVSILDDGLVEGPETFEAALSTLRGAGVGAVDVTTVTIEDYEPGEIGFAAAEYEVAENSRTLELVLERRGGTDGDVSVAVGLVEVAGGATRGEDFARATGGVLGFPAGVDLATVQVDIFDDRLVEGDERFRAQITGVEGGATVGAADRAEVVIRDYEEGALRFAVAEQTVLEDEGPVRLAVSRVDGADGPVSVRFEVRDGTAARSEDFSSSSEASLSWPDGDASDRFVELETVDDDALEGPETFTVALSAPEGAALGEPRTMAVTIQDREPGQVAPVSATSSVAETAGSVQIAVIRRDGDQGALELPWTVEAGTAEADVDFAQAQGTLRWQDGEAGAKVVEVGILDDDDSDPAETFRLRLGPLEGPATLTAGLVEVTIVDDEPEGCGCAAAEPPRDRGPNLLLFGALAALWLGRGRRARR